MPQIFNQQNSKRLTAFLAILFIFIIVIQGDIAAQEQDPAETAPHITPIMQALLDDRQPVQDRAPQAYAPCVDGDAGGYPCSNIDLMAFLPLSTFGAGSGNDIWGWTDPLNGKEYALMGLNNGTAFVDISDPVNPIYLGKLPTHSGSSSWRDIKVYDNHAFIVSEAGGHGMQIFDLTELRSVASPPVTFNETAHYSGFGNAHNIVVNEDSGYAYGVGTGTCSGGLHMVDIQNPTSPTSAGCFSSAGYTHDAQCVSYIGPDPDYQGREICVNSNGNTAVVIVDVTDKNNPQQIASKTYSGQGYIHQGWLTPDHRYYLLSDELDESSFGHNTWTRIWDFSDLDNPTLIGIYEGPTAAIDHNLYTTDDYIYEANYEAGLRILDSADIAAASLTEVAYFDTYPGSNNTSFNGAWSNYPYFDSGLVVISGIDEGLYIVQPTLEPDFRLDGQDTLLEVCGSDSDSVTLELTDRNGYTGSVSLSDLGLPGGASAAFGTNPVNVPGSSLLTVTTAGTAAGEYPFQVLGDDGTLTHTLDLTLNVFDGLPGTPAPQQPADGANNIELVPTFQWTAAVQAGSYSLEVATDAGFGNIIYSTTVITESHMMNSALDPLTTYYWRVQAGNLCGSGSTSSSFSFTTMDIPPILLVDDDDNSPDVRSYYTATLDALGADYDIWDTGNSDNEPDTGALQPYEAVIWFTGDEFGGAAGPGSSGEGALGSWLDGGGCLFLSSQDYHYDRGLTSFMSSYLGAGSVSDDTGSYSSVTGQGPFAGLGSLSLNYGSLSDFSDVVNAGAAADLAFEGNNSNDAAIYKESSVYQTTFLGFPFAAVSSDTDRQAVLGAFLNWCGSAQASGTLQGTVSDAGSGGPISNVLIEASGETGLLSTTSDASGSYQLALPVGTYDLQASASGYLPASISGVNILTDTVTVQDFDLVAAIGLLDHTMTAIEETVIFGELVSNTFMIENSGTISVSFNISAGGAPWVGIDPTGGTLAPGQSLPVTVWFDSSVVSQPGTYNADLTFSGTFDNNPPAITLTMHVMEEPENEFLIFLPLALSPPTD